MKVNLVQASRVEQGVRDHITYEGWGQRLSLDQYLTREKRLRSEAWSGYSIEMWLLKNEQGEVLSSCEVYPIFKNQILGIGSVFTEQKWRGQGFATRLLQELSCFYGSKQDSAAQAMVLFSEVGEKIYQRAGFQSLDSFEWVISVSSSTVQHFASSSCQEAPGSALRVQPLSVLQDLPALLQSPFQNKGSFCVLPSVDQLKWHFLRESIYAEMLGRPRSEFFGSRLGSSFIVWMLDYKWDCLRVLVSSFSDSPSGDALMRFACSYAHQNRLREVRIWDTDQGEREVLQQYPSEDILRMRREDSIAMVCPLSEEMKKCSWGRVQRGIWI